MLQGVHEGFRFRRDRLRRLAVDRPGTVLFTGGVLCTAAAAAAGGGGGGAVFA